MNNYKYAMMSYSYFITLQECNHNTNFKQFSVDMYHIIFLCITQEDNTATVMLPHHPPEVIHCVLQWTLCCNVGSTVFITLYNEDMCIIVQHGILNSVYCMLTSMKEALM